MKRRHRGGGRDMVVRADTGYAWRWKSRREDEERRSANSQIYIGEMQEFTVLTFVTVRGERTSGFTRGRE